MSRTRKAGGLWISLILASHAGLFACASLPPITGGVLPGVDISAHQPVHVIRHPADSRGLDKVVATELRRHGIEATSGPEGERPATTRAVLRYEDRWTWDMRTYLSFFRADIRDADTDVLLASAQSDQGSLGAMGQTYQDIVSDVVREVVTGKLAP